MDMMGPIALQDMVTPAAAVAPDMFVFLSEAVMDLMRDELDCQDAITALHTYFCQLVMYHLQIHNSIFSSIFPVIYHLLMSLPICVIFDFLFV